MTVRYEGFGLSVAVTDYTPRQIGGSTTALPAAFTTTAHSPDADFEVRFEVEVTEPGAVYVRRVELVADELSGVTTANLRSVPLDRLLQGSLGLTCLVLERRLEGGHLILRRPDASEAEEVEHRIRTALSKRPGRRARGNAAVTPERLHLVADIYRRPRNKKAPTKAVAKELNVTESRAAALVGLARKEGILGPARPGRPGEVKS